MKHVFAIIARVVLDNTKSGCYSSCLCSRMKDKTKCVLVTIHVT